MHHAYDFYKPDMASEYPTVDGPYSLRCYMEALEKCYDKFCDKFEDRILNGKYIRLTGKVAGSTCSDSFIQRVSSRSSILISFQC